MSEGGRAPVIFSCNGGRLSIEERVFFAAIRPAGFILMGRNCQTPEQVRDLIAELRAVVEDEATPILVDQEGGHVQRLRPPHWADLPAPAMVGALYQADPAAGLMAARLHGRVIADQLAPLGFNVDCAPTLDVRREETHPFLQQRTFAGTSAAVIALSRAWRDGLEAGGVSVAIKHAPGHGRATVDSHDDMPEVRADETEMADDLAPFAAHHDAPWVLTAHIRYSAWDRHNPATFSPTIIEDVLRRRTGLTGVLVTDDLNMNALGGDLAERTRRSLAAGCDLALHCKGEMAEMQMVASGLPAMRQETADRLAIARRHQDRLAEGESDPNGGKDRLISLLRFLGDQA